MEVNAEKLIILFDGVCNLCNGAIQFVIKRDKQDRFRFAALQSDVGQQMIRERHIDTEKTDSIILIDPGIAYYTESEAALRIVQEFGGVWNLMGLFHWMPASFRDPIYRWVARNRYKWFGKKEECMVPSPELRAKFLSEAAPGNGQRV